MRIKRFIADATSVESNIETEEGMAPFSGKSVRTATHTQKALHACRTQRPLIA